jgi:hypothetical protein
MTMHGECCFVGTRAELQLALNATLLQDRSCFNTNGTRRTVWTAEQTVCLLCLFEMFPCKQVQRGAMCACITCCMCHLSLVTCIRQLVTALYSVAFRCCEEASWRSSECMNRSTTDAGTWTRESWWSREWEWTKYYRFCDNRSRLRSRALLWGEQLCRKRKLYECCQRL